MKINGEKTKEIKNSNLNKHEPLKLELAEEELEKEKDIKYMGFIICESGENNRRFWLPLESRVFSLSTRVRILDCTKAQLVFYGSESRTRNVKIKDLLE